MLATSSRDVDDPVVGNARRQADSHQLGDHGDDVYAVAFSAQGDRLASASGDKTIKLWDPSNSKVFADVRGPHRHRAVGDLSARSERRSASGGVDMTVRLWDVPTGHLKQTLTGHTHRVKSVVCTPDGKMLASCSSDKTIRLWDVASGDVRFVLTGHTGDLETVAISPDGSVLASSSGDGTVRLWAVGNRASSAADTFRPHRRSRFGDVFARRQNIGQRLQGPVRQAVGCRNRQSNPQHHRPESQARSSRLLARRQDTGRHQRRPGVAGVVMADRAVTGPEIRSLSACRLAQFRRCPLCGLRAIRAAGRFSCRLRRQ